MSYDPQQGPYGPPRQPYGQPYGQQPPPVVSGPPIQPQSGWQPYPPPGQAPAPKRKSKAPLIIGVIAAVLVGFCLFGAALSNLQGDDKKTTVTPPQSTGKAHAKPPAEDAGEEGEPAADDKGAFDVPVGSKITATAGDGSVIEATLRSVKTSKKGCNSLDVDPDNGMYVIVDVLVVQKKGTGSVNPLDFTFVTDEGTSNNALSGKFSGCDEPSLDAADLRSGQKRAGKIAFDVSGKAGSLEWAPGGLGADTVGSWKTK